MFSTIVARRVGDASSLRKALTIEGGILIEALNIPGSLKCSLDALRLAVDLDDRVGQCVTLTNLGVALRDASLHEEALLAFDRACSVLPAHGPNLNRLAAARGNAAWSCLLHRQYTAGIDHCRKAIELSEDTSTSSLRQSLLHRRATYARLLICIGDLDSAKRQLDHAKRLFGLYPQDSVLVRSRVFLSIAEGLYELAMGMTDMALTRLSGVLHQARLFSIFVPDALQALIDANRESGRPQSSLVYERELSLYLRDVSRDAILLHHELHLRLLSRSGPVRFAIDGDADGSSLSEAELSSRYELLEQIAVTAEFRDDPSGAHVYRVGRLASLLAEAYGCDERTCFLIDLAGRLHDVGKASVPDKVVLKPGTLDPHEKQRIREHTNSGADLIEKAGVPYVRMAEEIARFHHEWWDGSGYPFGISAESIPIAARIVALADAFDSMTHDRPHRPAMSTHLALTEISMLKGRKFEPHLVDVFLELVPRLQAMHGDLDAYLSIAAGDSAFYRARQEISRFLRCALPVHRFPVSRPDLVARQSRDPH